MIQDASLGSTCHQGREAMDGHAAKGKKAGLCIILFFNGCIAYKWSRLVAHFGQSYWRVLTG